MNLADKLHDNLSGGNRQGEQAVIICLQFPPGKLEGKRALAAVIDLDTILRVVVDASHVGLYAGHSFFKSAEEEQITFVIFGRDARKIYNEIKPILQSLPTLPVSSIIKRYASASQAMFSVNS